MEGIKVGNDSDAITFSVIVSVKFEQRYYRFKR
jgi:hypothetical protein